MSVREQQHRAVPAPTRRGLSRVEAAGYIGVSPTLFDRLVTDGRMPAPLRVDGRRVWGVRQIDLAFDALPREGGDDAPNEWDSVYAPEAT